MQSDKIDELQALTERLWATSGVCCDRVWIARERSDDGSAHVEVVADCYDIVVTERGREVRRIAGLSLAEAARWFLFRMATRHAQSEERRSRSVPKNGRPLLNGLNDDGYSRWNWMAPTIEIMNRISPGLGAWTLHEYRRVLDRAPLADHEKRNARHPLPPEFK